MPSWGTVPLSSISAWGPLTRRSYPARSITFRMDGDRRHARPHVHIGFGKDHRKASYAIDDGTRLVGDLEPRYDAAIRSWILSRKNDLLELWRTVQAGQDRTAIVEKIRHTEYA
jgi:hypothetical protein